MHAIRITGLDHIVLTVRDIDEAVAFYTRVLAMNVRTSPQGRVSLHCGPQKINLHQAGEEFEPHARVPATGAADICLLTATPPEETLALLDLHDVEVVEGPVERHGAAGPITSVYVRDPDGNLIEIAWPIPPKPDF